MKITRPHHPLEGQVLEVLRGGPRQIVVLPPDGAPMRVPREWTDADRVLTHVGPARVFSVDALRELIQLVDALRRRPPTGSAGA